MSTDATLKMCVQRHVVLPSRVYADSRLTGTDRDVLAIMSVAGGGDVEGRDGWFSVKQNDLAALAGKTKGTINAAIKKLTAANYLEKKDNTTGGRGPSIYRIKHDGYLPVVFDLWADRAVQSADRAVQSADRAVQSADRAVQSADHDQPKKNNKNNVVQSADRGPFKSKSLDSFIKDFRFKISDQPVDEDVLNVVSTFMGYRAFYFPNDTSILKAETQIATVVDLLAKGIPASGLIEIIESSVPHAATQYADRPYVKINSIKFFSTTLKERFPIAFMRSPTTSSQKDQQAKSLPITAYDLQCWQAAIDQASAVDSQVEQWSTKFALLGVQNQELHIAVWTVTIRGILQDSTALQAALNQHFPSLKVVWRERDEWVILAKETAAKLLQAA